LSVRSIRNQSAKRKNARLNHIGWDAEIRTFPAMPWSIRLRMMLGCRWTVAVGTPSRSCAMRAPNAMPDDATMVVASACCSMSRYTAPIAGRMARRAMTSNPLRGCHRSGSAIVARAFSIVPTGRNPTPCPSINS
jgi:hypothetical protein